MVNTLIPILKIVIGVAFAFFAGTALSRASPNKAIKEKYSVKNLDIGDVVPVCAFVWLL